MNNKQIKAKIEKILKKDERLWNKDKTELNQTLRKILFELQPKNKRV